MNANNTWDPAQYDASFGFVTRHGAAVLDLLGDVRGQVVVDLGCGTGHLTRQIADKGAAAVLGVDQSAQMVQAARAGYPQLRFERGDGQALALAALGLDRAVDAVFSNAALHWMPDGAAVSRSVRSILRPGGRFVAELGGSGNVAAVDAALRGGLADVGLPGIALPAQNFPSVARQASWLEDGGFRVRLARWFERPTPLADGLTAASWTQHFRADVWAQVPAQARQELAAAIDGRAEAEGLASGGWHIDYCRLQFVAEAV